MDFLRAQFTPSRVITAIFVVQLLLGGATSYKVLVSPIMCGFNSRLLNMQKMADMLAQDGHQVDVIMNNRVTDRAIIKNARVVKFEVPDVFPDISSFTIADMNIQGLEFFRLLDKIATIEIPFCDTLFQNDTLMQQIRDTEYDLILADTISLCSGVLISHLNVTAIFYQNFGFWPDSRAFFPLFPSFTCQSAGAVCVNDDMTFYERVLNTLFLAVSNYYMSPRNSMWQTDMAERANLQLKVPVETAMENKVMLINNDNVLEEPRPTMPHVFMISGLFHKKPSPLNAEFQKIIDQSGSHGVVLMSFGTLVPKFETEIAEKFARVLGKLKQQVIWRYTGEKPKGLKANTHLTEWFPQNDLLANPAAKLFITHCGISSTFESVYNGVPVVAMPLFADQQMNALKLTKRVKSGIKLEYYSFTEEELEQVINEVLSNPFYRDNAMRASLTMSDQVVPPIQQFRHLVNFTIKTEGAKHLFHPYAVRMSWFTYFSVDVLLFLFLLLIAVATAFYLVLLTFYRCCFKIISRQEKFKEQ